MRRLTITSTTHAASWVILGGERQDLYKQAFSAVLVIHQSGARTPQLTTYMENC